MGVAYHTGRDFDARQTVHLHMYVSYRFIDAAVDAHAALWPACQRWAR